MSSINREKIVSTLKNIIDYDINKDIVTAGMVSDININDGNIAFALEIDPTQAEQKEPLRQKCEDMVKQIEGVKKVRVALTNKKGSKPMLEKHPVKEREAAKDLKEARKKHMLKTPPQPIKHVKKIISVASGKGGVGKSTVAMNLAIEFSKLGYKTAIADADIYGPSVPKMLGTEQKPEIDPKTNCMIPIIKHGIKSMSIGYIIDTAGAAIWRAPMAIKALNQLLRYTLWNCDGEDVDILVLDLPPGTGDIHITLAESYKVDGAVIVSTPQDIALLDAAKAVVMFEKIEANIFGLVENMSYFKDPESGNISYIFGEGGAKRYAKKANIPFLGEIPLNQNIREAGDEGTPAVIQIEEVAAIFKDIAQQVIAKL
jgi:ATP-binding protein involved in chromosome partitioning